MVPDFTEAELARHDFKFRFSMLDYFIETNCCCAKLCLVTGKNWLRYEPQSFLSQLQKF